MAWLSTHTRAAGHGLMMRQFPDGLQRLFGEYALRSSDLDWRVRPQSKRDYPVLPLSGRSRHLPGDSGRMKAGVDSRQVALMACRPQMHQTVNFDLHHVVDEKPYERIAPH